MPLLRCLWVRLTVIALAVALPVIPFAMQILIPPKQPPSAHAAGDALADFLERQDNFSASLLTFVTPNLVHPWWGYAVVAWYRGY